MSRTKTKPKKPKRRKPDGKFNHLHIKASAGELADWTECAAFANMNRSKWVRSTLNSAAIAQLMPLYS